MSWLAPRRLVPFLVAASACLVILSCRPEDKHRWLTVFFDGVPPLHPPEDAKGTEAVAKPQVAPATPTERPALPKIVWHEHKATQGKTACRSCHNADASYALLRPPTELCVGCHLKDTRQFPRMHGPVALGHCSVCHEPHRSPNKHLVRATPDKLCFLCHEHTPKGGATMGCSRKADDANCVACHHPHGGMDAFFLAGRPRPASGTGEPPSGFSPEAREP